MGHALGLYGPKTFADLNIIRSVNGGVKTGHLAA